jgi:hypothetical protein
MALSEVPIIYNDAAFKMRTTLDNVEVVLDFEWNSRTSLWTMSIYDAAENPLVLGLALVVDTFLIGKFRNPGLPPEELVLYDSSGKHVEAGRDDLGDRCKLFYGPAN